MRNDLPEPAVPLTTSRRGVNGRDKYLSRGVLFVQVLPVFSSTLDPDMLTEPGDCCETKIQVVRVHFPREEATDPCLDYQRHQNRQDALRSWQNFAVPTQRAYWHRHLHPDRFSKPHEEDCVVLCQISNIVHESESCLWIWQTHTCTRKYQP
ncbi:hypothetical protein DPMN_109796 [Dreissena polymorpha]|uniref:Uncharacterized protein n=1 Tax=Dreissena polymorpha TaxID=45954 RepID=A0A9D4KBU2_DREPO|nr:hypothetical protein DPMN_109796 [Dreissena polymorpha]